VQTGFNLSNENTVDVNGLNQQLQPPKHQDSAGPPVNFYQAGETSDISLNATLNAYSIYQKALGIR
jgi:hypothetical protein